jgi:hypothetical protein
MISAPTEKPDIDAAAVFANHARKPTLASPSAMATRVANHTSTFHAVLWLMTSSQVITLVRTMRHTPMRATVVASNCLPPKIHSRSAMMASAPMVSSLRLVDPIFASSAPAHFGASALSFTVGG